MRTNEQIIDIKDTEGPPVQLWNVVSKNEIEKLLNHYRTSNDVIEKDTGPKVLNIKPGEGLIDDIIEELQLRFGDFKVRNAHIFDVTKPHIIHNDDDFKYPQVYKGFVIPLHVEGPEAKAKFFVFDQYYYDGPAKFVNELDTKDLPVHYNQFVTNYDRVERTNTFGIQNEIRKELSHLQPEWLKGLSIRAYFPWQIGSIIAFDCCNLHCAGDFTKYNIKSKIGLSIFTQL